MCNYYRYIIDGNEYKAPLVQMSDDIKRDYEQRWVINYNEGTLKFGKDLYDFLKSELKENGYCGVYDIQIQKRNNTSESWEDDIVGEIHLSSCIFHHEDESVDVEVFDQGFEAKIKNNRGFKIDPNSSLSKNGETITKVTPVNVSLFDTTDGTTSGSVSAYDLKDVFEHQVQYMSDGVVGFESDWYDNLDEEHKYIITTGRQLRLNDDIERPLISFSDLFETISRLYNLHILLDNSSGSPVLRIEDIDYTFTDDDVFVLSDCRDIDQGVLERLLYGAVDFGTSRVADGERLDVRFMTVGNENYSVTGSCNTEITLNLSIERVIIDTNIIHDVEVDGNDTYDKDVFLIQYTDDAVPNATQCDPLGIGQHLYNGELFNNKVAQRYNLGGALAAYLGDGNDECYVTRSADTAINPATEEPYDFLTEVSDPNNNFASRRYTAPADGVYSIALRMVFEVTSPGAPNELNRYYLKRFNSVNVLQETYPYSSTSGSLPAKVNIYNTSGVLVYTTFTTMNADVAFVSLARNDYGLSEGTIEFIFENIYFESGDYIQFRFESNNTPLGSYKFLEETNLEVYNTITGGGIFVVGDSATYNSSFIEFRHPISDEDWEAIRDEPWKSFTVKSRNNDIYKVWVDNISRDRKTKIADRKSVV